MILSSFFSNLENPVTLAGIQSCVNTLAQPVVKTYHYMKDNFPLLTKHLISWAVIITCLGMLYGFTATAEPLAIGMGCGIGFGVLLGIVKWKVLEKTRFDLNKHQANTIWKNIYSLAETNIGTSGILSTVVVTVIFAALAIFPFEVGIIMGVIIGSHEVVLCILHKKKEPAPPAQVEEGELSLAAKVETLSARIALLEQQKGPPSDKQH